MLSILDTLCLFSGSRGPHGPDLPSPCRRKFHISLSHTPCHVMSVGDFNLRLESFGCTHKNPSDPVLKNIQKQLNLIYLNNDEHMHMDRAKGSTDILDMVLISPNLAKHDIQFQISDDLGSDHLPIEIEISIDTPPPPHIVIHLLTTPSTNLTRLTKKYSNQHSRKRHTYLAGRLA